MTSPVRQQCWGRVAVLVLAAGASEAATPCPVVPNSTLTQSDARTELTVEAMAPNGAPARDHLFALRRPFSAKCTEDEVLLTDGVGPDAVSLRLRYVASRRRLSLVDDVEGLARSLAARGQRTRLERLGAMLGALTLWSNPEFADVDVGIGRLATRITELLDGGTAEAAGLAPTVILRSNFGHPFTSIGTMPATVPGGAFDDASASPAFWSGARFCVAQGDEGESGEARCLDPTTRKWGRLVPLAKVPRASSPATRATFCEGSFSQSLGPSQAREAASEQMLGQETMFDTACLSAATRTRHLLPSPDGRYVVVVDEGSPEVPPFREGQGGFEAVPHRLTLAEVDSATTTGRSWACETVTGGVLQLLQVSRRDGRPLERFEAFSDQFAFEAPPGQFAIECTREVMEFRPTRSGAVAFAPISLRWRHGALELATDVASELARAGNDRAALERLRATLACVRTASTRGVREAASRVDARLEGAPR